MKDFIYSLALITLHPNIRGLHCLCRPFRSHSTQTGHLPLPFSCHRSGTKRRKAPDGQPYLHQQLKASSAGCRDLERAPSANTEPDDAILRILLSLNVTGLNRRNETTEVESSRSTTHRQLAPSFPRIAQPQLLPQSLVGWFESCLNLSSDPLWLCRQVDVN